jgi:hypothetical protein
LTLPASAPDVFERFRTHGRVANRIRNRGVPEVVLQTAGIHAPGGQCKAGGMPEHMDVDGERKLSRFACPLDHAGDPHAAEWLATLVDEYVGRLGLLFLLQSLQASQFVAFEEVHTVGTALQPANGDGPFQ